MKPVHLAILGAGGIGRALGLILAEWSDFPVVLHLGDAYAQAAAEAADWIQSGTTKPCTVHAFTMPKEGINEAMEQALSQAQIVLDCLPGSQAPRIAELARRFNIHYANLTEYVRETEAVVEIAQDAPKGFVLQTGLAPGYINVLAHDLYLDFCQTFGVSVVDHIQMKVGALSQHALAPHFYGFTWSPVGVATEYIKPALVVRDFKTQSTPSLSEREQLIIEGRYYEADLTSGGAADLPQALAGKVRNLEYKTLRYPGHYNWVEAQLQNQERNEEAITLLQKNMESVVPRLEDDVVVIYASVTGRDQRGWLHSKEKAFHIYPQQVGKHTLRAIQTTTAAPLAEVARMLLQGHLQGPIFQSQLPTQAFLSGLYVSKVYGQK